MTGNLSASDGVETKVLSGLDFKETGNNSSGDFSDNTNTFSVDFTSGAGFLVQLQAVLWVTNSNSVQPAQEAAS